MEISAASSLCLIFFTIILTSLVAIPILTTVIYTWLQFLFKRIHILQNNSLCCWQCLQMIQLNVQVVCRCEVQAPALPNRILRHLQSLHQLWGYATSSGRHSLFTRRENTFAWYCWGLDRQNIHCHGKNGWVAGAIALILNVNSYSIEKGSQFIPASSPASCHLPHHQCLGDTCQLLVPMHSVLVVIAYGNRGVEYPCYHVLVGHDWH